MFVNSLLPHIIRLLVVCPCSDMGRRMGFGIWGIWGLCLPWLGLPWLGGPSAMAGTLGQPIPDRLRTSASLDPAESFPRSGAFPKSGAFPGSKAMRQGKSPNVPRVRPIMSGYSPGIGRRPDIPHPAVVRVIAPEKGVISYGSGTLIDVRDQFGLVITNWHVVRDAQGTVEVLFPDGFRSKARALKVDEDWDLAALVIWRPSVPPVSLATVAPRPGDQLTICGYGQGRYRAETGRCTQYYAPREDFPQHMVELDVEARQGDSGGPIFNQQGQLAGVLFGAGQGTTLGSFGGRVQSFLATHAPDIGRRADDALLQAVTTQSGSGITNGGTINGGTASPSATNRRPAGPSSQPLHSAASRLAEGDRPEVGNPGEVWKSPMHPESEYGGIGATAGGADGTEPMGRVEEVAVWRALAGTRWYEQVKTVLAAIGLLAIAGGVLRAVR